MTLTDLIAGLAKSHIKIGIGTQPDKLRLEAAHGQVPAEIVVAVREHKAELLGMLGSGCSRADMAQSRQAATRAASALPSISSVAANRSPATGSIDHRILRNVDELRTLVDLLVADRDATNIAVDAEWHGSYPAAPGAYVRTIQFSWRPGCAACVVLRAPGGADTFGPTPAAAIPQLRRLLTSTAERRVRIIGHFFRADLPWLAYEGVDLRDEFCGGLADSPEQSGATEAPWEITRRVGGFDIGLAAHAHNEATELGLKALSRLHAIVPDYDEALRQWCSGQKNLAGFGDCPEEILIPYSIWDADATRRLFDLYNRPGGLLDRDIHGNSSRRAFWVAMCATAGIIEMESTGIRINPARLTKLTAIFRAGHEELLAGLRDAIHWPSFNPASPQHCREFLFGERYSGKKDATGSPKSVRPAGALSLKLSPVRTTGKPARAWSQLRTESERDNATPAADKETLGILAQASPIARMLRDLRIIAQPLKTTLRVDGAGAHASSLAANVRVDGRIHTTIRQVTETGRYSSSNPPLQNISQKREADYRRVLGSNHTFPIRSVFEATDGHVLVEADYVGAELAAMAWLSGDPAMTEHVRRNSLPETNPDYYDIHSHVAVAAFQLTCPATKVGLKQAGQSHLRTVAKSVIFGIAYGRGAKAIAQAAEEEGIHIQVNEAEAIISAIFSTYPRLEPFFNACRQRVKHPRWLQNSFGRLRRFPLARSLSELGGFEREAMNFPVQSLIADAVSQAIHNLVQYRRNHSTADVDYRLLLQIHDAVLLEVPIRSVARVVDEVLPACLCQQVPIWPCNPAGQQTGAGPHHLGIDVKVAKNWGVSLSAAETNSLGLPARFAAE